MITDTRRSLKFYLEEAELDSEAEVTGWVRTSRFGKKTGFVHLYDGSSAKTLQVVIPREIIEDCRKGIDIGASIKVFGKVVKSPGSEQPVEILAFKIEVIGYSDPADYPIQKKETSDEFFRSIAHLRPRVDQYQSVFRIRNALSWQIHKFFQEREFMWVHTPIISTSDCEGAGEAFKIVTDHDKPFFDKEVMLTVSGQLNVETFAQAFSKVYTFGPTFRAENSNTSRHASEFWMVEPEISFADLNDLIKLEEQFIKTITLDTIKQCQSDFEKLCPDTMTSIMKMLEGKFSRLTHEDAQKILVDSKREFKYPVGYRESLQAEHERFLAEEYFKGPVFVTDYPEEQKAFYMRLSDDGKTVAANDLLVPKVGEIIGGSQREERLDVLIQRMEKLKMETAPYWWYLDLRKYGTTPHAGFGLGLERMLMWITGTKNIRDVIPFARTPGSAEF